MRYNFPADAEYLFKASLVFTRNAFLFGSTAAGEQLEIAVDGTRVALFPINPLMKGVDNDLETQRVKVEAGPHTISAAFVNKNDGPIDDFLRRPERALGDDFVGQTPGLTGLPHLRELGVEGPYNITGISDMPSRRRIFVCRPKRAAEEPACARTILVDAGAPGLPAARLDASFNEVWGAYRRRPRPRRLRRRHPAGAAGRDGPSRSSSSASSATPAGVAGGTTFRLDDLELASRLSFFLWSSIPDDELLTLAAQAKLKDPAVLERQVRRMLADRASKRWSTNFAGAVAAPAEPRRASSRTSICFPTSTTTCARRCSARPSCSSTASSARTAACSIC